VQVPGARRDVEDRVRPGREVAIQDRCSRKRRPGERGAGERLTNHLTDPLDAGLEDRVVDVGEDPEARVWSWNSHLERRGVRAGQPPVLAVELDGAAGPWPLELVGVRAEAGEEVALGVGDDLDARARDGHPQWHARQFVGHEVTQRAAYRGADPLPLNRLRARRVIEDTSPHDHSLGTAVPDVRLDPEVGWRS
jgi:hypothetical protein